MNLEAWLALLEQRHPQAVELGLERCGAVYRRLGSPRPAKQVYTVAGTNGKGSTVAYLAAMCGALGRSYGTYTSPHIFRFNERISIMGEAVSDDCLIRAFEQVEAVRGEISLTYFEFTTLAALLILQQSALDCVILEVGLGGRLDTTNLVDADCVVITPIGLDHQDFLGDDINSIAAEKAGVLRSGAAVVCTETNPPAAVTLTAKELGSPLYRRGIDFDLGLAGDTGTAINPLQFSLGDQLIPVPPPSMGGKHQTDNLATALAALLLLNPDGFNKADNLSAAIRSCRLPGRLQRVGTSPEILLDVGHNEMAAEVVASFLKDNKRSNTCCVLAMLADKSAEAVALALGGLCKRWLCADSSGPRGQSGEMLASRIRTALPGADVSSFGSIDNAMQEAVSTVSTDETVLVFGSFMTMAAASHWLENSMQRDGHDAAKLTNGEPVTWPPGNHDG